MNGEVKKKILGDDDVKNRSTRPDEVPRRSNGKKRR